MASEKTKTNNEQDSNGPPQTAMIQYPISTAIISSNNDTTNNTQPSSDSSPTFEPYKIYKLKAESGEPFHWLCKCTKGRDGSAEIECSNCAFNANWGHAKCYGYMDDGFANVPKDVMDKLIHKCYDCRTLTRKGRKKKWTRNDTKLVIKLRDNERYEWERVARALERTVADTQKKYNAIKLLRENNENNIENSIENKNEMINIENDNESAENTNNAKKKTYNCDVCGQQGFKNGKALGGHKGSHTKKERRKTKQKPKSFNKSNYNTNRNSNRNINGNEKKKHDYNMRPRTNKNKNRNCKRDGAFGGHRSESDNDNDLSTRKRKYPLGNYNRRNNYNVTESDSDSSDNSVEVLRNNSQKRKGRKGRKSELRNASLNNNGRKSRRKHKIRVHKETEDEPPAKKQKCANNNSINNNNDNNNNNINQSDGGFGIEVPFSQWTSEETLYDLSSNINEFNVLMNNDSNFKKKWKNRDMNGETLIFAYENKDYNYLHQLGINGALLVMKIMNAIENKMN